MSRLESNRAAIEIAVEELSAKGETALYDAIRAGIEMTDNAPGEADAIRAVIVLTDGKANRGSSGLDDIILMASRAENIIRDFGEDIEISRIPLKGEHGTDIGRRCFERIT